MIGSALVDHLRRSGHAVIRLVRRPPGARDERQWDPPAARFADGALDGVDAVVNLCGARVGDRRWSAARKQELLDSRVVPSEVLAQAVADRGIPVMVSASAIGYYGDTGERVVDETALAGTDFMAGLCRRWESACTPARDAGARVVNIRSGHVMAARGGLVGPYKLAFALFLGARFGDGRQYVSWMSLEDEVAAIRFVLENDQVSDAVNLTSPHPVTNAGFTAALSRVLRRPAPWVVPGVILRTILGREMADGVLTGQRVAPTVLTRHGFQHHRPDLDDALSAVLRPRRPAERGAR